MLFLFLNITSFRVETPTIISVKATPLILDIEQLGLIVFGIFSNWSLSPTIKLLPGDTMSIESIPDLRILVTINSCLYFVSILLIGKYPEFSEFR